MTQNNAEYSNDDLKPVSSFRRILPQVLASTAKNFLLTGLGAAISYATIITPVMLSGSDTITMNDVEASWFGSLCFICQPIGSLISGAIMEPIGRKKALMIVNLPHILAWILMWKAENVTTIFIANALLGFGTGLMEAPIITYIGEICEPAVRGILIAYSGVFASFGIFIMYFFGTILHWRTAAIACLSIPIATIVVVSFVPESPIWLISKGRDKEAMRCLCWLRGWVKPPLVKEEFEALKAYNEKNFQCKECDVPSKMPCTHGNDSRWKRFVSSIKELTKRNTRRPLILSSLLFLFSIMTGMSAIKPNMVNIFQAFNMTIDAHWATVGVGLLTILGSIICMSVVKFSGKRPLMLVNMVGACISTLLLGIYAYYNIPHDLNTYAPMEANTSEGSTIPLILFIVMVMCHSCGIILIPWVIISEVFPYKTRGYASGIVAAVCYLISFVASKTYIDIERTFHIYGAFYFYSAFTLVGVIFIYLALPETENRKHEDIEDDFMGDNVKIFAKDFLTLKIVAALRKKSIHVENSTYEKNIVTGNNQSRNTQTQKQEITYDNKGYITDSDLLGDYNKVKEFARL